MKIFLSAIETKEVAEYMIENNIKMQYNLMSYFYIRNKKKLAEKIRDNTKEILIDSGAHSFQKGTKVEWEEYTRQYAEFIKEFDRPNIIGFFEMDVDNVIGYEKVLELRKILESVTDKIIPVWHKNRGIEEFKKMCKDYSGKIIAITGFKNEDIRDEQYIMFLKYAKKYNCKVHCLGMTRKKILNNVPFDYVDSSSWLQSSIYGNFKGKHFDKKCNMHNEVAIKNYLLYMEEQRKYKDKWRKYE